jgi:serine/threonine-protein kinase
MYHQGVVALDEDKLPEHARARVGSVLKGKWRLVELLGVGGMAAVYAATHRNGKRVAVKVLHPELSVRRDIKERFLREGYAANRIDHPGAVSILDDEIDADGTVFLVMDLLDGETLEQRLQRKGKRLDPAEVMAIGYRLLGVLAAAHDKGVVHRDIKPENVMLTRDGSLKILDFGIAHMRESTTSVTRSSSSYGTPAYMSPEQARGRWELVDAQSDLWAVGATMFTLIAGRTVHEAGTPNEYLLAAMTTPAPSLASLAPDVPAPIAAIVDRALAFDKEQRWPDARAMEEAIQSAYTALYGGAVDAPDSEGRRSLPTDAARLPVANASDDEPPIEETITKVLDEGQVKTAGPPSGAAADTTTQSPLEKNALSSRAPAARAGRSRPIAMAAGVLLVAGAAYLALGRGQGRPPASGSATAAVSLAPPPSPGPAPTATGSEVTAPTVAPPAPAAPSDEPSATVRTTPQPTSRPPIERVAPPRASASPSAPPPLPPPSSTAPAPPPTAPANPLNRRL